MFNNSRAARPLHLPKACSLQTPHLSPKEEGLAVIRCLLFVCFANENQSAGSSGSQLQGSQLTPSVSPCHRSPLSQAEPLRLEVLSSSRASKELWDPQKSVFMSLQVRFSA